MFDANAEDELWHNQERWNFKSWDFYENCGVHTLILEDGTEIHMLAERKYPLIKETLERMISLTLVTETASEDASTLLRFIQKQIDEYGSHDREQTASELASPKQTALGKDISNPLIVDSLLKTIWLSMHLFIAMKHWLFQSKWLLDRKWYDELANEKLKEEALMHKARFKESWGGATPREMKFYAWLKCSFENFHELDYDVLVKLEECWWKVYDFYLDINRVFGRNYRANNASNTQDNKKEHHDPSICNIRRFEMMKYSFDDDDKYFAIKELKHSDHSRTNVDACKTYRELFRIMDEGWLVTKAKE
ncbi:hypothetical protein Tco_0481126 [Tanacetum coccineum]